jgi:hypothetical protein
MGLNPRTATYFLFYLGQFLFSTDTRHPGLTPCRTGKELRDLHTNKLHGPTPTAADQLLAGLAKSSERVPNILIYLVTRHPRSTPCRPGKEFRNVWNYLFIESDTLPHPNKINSLPVQRRVQIHSYIHLFSLTTPTPGIISLPDWQRVENSSETRQWVQGKKGMLMYDSTKQ